VFRPTCHDSSPGPPDGPELTRRELLEAGAAASAVAALPDGAQAQQRPNLILIVLDTVRADYVSAYGGRARTPHIDSLARRGIRFANAYPEAMATVPARRSIMLGRRVFPFRGWRRGADGMPGWEVPGWQGIDDMSETFTNTLRRAGYWTAYVTDNPHIAHARAFRNLRRSFDRYLRIAGQAGHAPRPAHVSDAELRRWLPPDLYRDRDLRVRVRNYLSHGHYWRDERRSFAARVFGAASQVLEEATAQPKPFALVIDAFEPHEPWTPPRRYIDMYGRRRGAEPGTLPYEPVRAWLRDRRRIQRMRDVYAAEVTLTDRWLGTFLRRLRELGLAGNTAIALVSDHGLLIGEHGWTGKTAFALHPELIHVPFVLVDPHGRAAGRTSSFFASTHDIGPTLLSLAGVRPPRGMDGFDLTPLFEGRRPGSRELAWGGYGNWFFARTDRWALTGDNRLRRRRLYDLRRDPRERRDVSRRHSRVVRGLTRAYVEQAGRRLPFYG
jgi:arylsulfatase A-like enzyme